MAKDMGMIAFGMVQAMKKRLSKLEEDLEEVKKSIRKEDTQSTKESEGNV